ERQDFVFAEVGLDFQGQQELVELAGPGFFGAQVEVARHLHGNGAGTLTFGAMQHVGHRSPHDAAPINPAVVVEVVVFGRKNGCFQDVGNFRNADDVAAFFTEFANQDVVGRINT